MDRLTYDDRLPADRILEVSLRQSADLCERWHGRDDGRLQYAFTPRFAVSCSADMLRESAALARADRRVLADPPVRGRRRAARGRPAVPRGARLPRRVRPGRRPRPADGPRPRDPPVDARGRAPRGDRQRASPTARPRTSSSPRGRCRSPATGRPGSGSASAPTSRRDPSCRSSPTCAPGRTSRTGCACCQGPCRTAGLGPLDWLRLGRSTARGRSGWTTRSARSSPARRPTSSPSIRALVAPVAGIDSDDPDEIMSRARVPAAPLDGPRGLGPRPPPRGPAGPERRRVSPQPVDLLIEGGTIVDGTGAAGFPGAVAVPGTTLRVLRGAAARPDATRRAPCATPDRRQRACRGPGLHRPPQPRRPDDPGRAAPRAEGPPGRHDRGHRRRRQRLRAVPDPADLDDFVTLNAGLDGRPDGLAYDWRTVADYLARYDRGVAVNIAYLVGNSALRIAAVGWDEVDGRARPSSRTSGRSCARRWRRAPSALSSGLDYPPGAYASTGRAGRAAGRGGPARRLLPHPRPLPARGRLPRPVPRGDRDRPALRRRPGPHHPLLPSGDVPGHARRTCSGSSTTRGPRASTSRFDLYPYEWASTRLLIMLPTWVQAGGVATLKERLADRAVRAADPRRARGARPAVRRSGRLATTSGSATSPAPSTRAGRAGRSATTWPTTGLDPVDGICELLLSEDLRVNQVDARDRIGPGSRRSSSTTQSMIGTDGVLIGAKPSPRTYGSLPADPRRVRPRGAAAEPRGGRPQDDRRRRPPGSA